MISLSLLIHPDELSEKWIDRMVRNGISILGIHPAGGGKAHLSLHELIQMLEEPSYRSLLDYAAAKGLAIEYEMHAMRYLLPAEEFLSHPEWFRMNSRGERTSDCNCCASSSEALDYIAENAALLAKKLYRSSNRYFFWTDDGKNISCHCPKCMGYSASDQQLIILNRILKRLKQDNDKATLAYLAYFDTVTPPVKIRPEEGIFPEYAPLERDFECTIRKQPQANILCEFLSFFGNKNAKVLDYWYDNSYFSHYQKPPAAFTPNHTLIAEDLAYYASLGIEDISGFACYLGRDYEALYGEPDIGDLLAFFKQDQHT